MTGDGDLSVDSNESGCPVDCRVSHATRRSDVVEHEISVAEHATWGGIRNALSVLADSAVLVDFGSDVTVTLIFHETPMTPADQDLFLSR